MVVGPSTPAGATLLTTLAVAVTSFLAERDFQASLDHFEKAACAGTCSCGQPVAIGFLIGTLVGLGSAAIWIRTSSHGAGSRGAEGASSSSGSTAGVEAARARLLEVPG